MKITSTPLFHRARGLLLALGLTATIGLGQSSLDVVLVQGQPLPDDPSETITSFPGSLQDGLAGNAVGGYSVVLQLASAGRVVWGSANGVAPTILLGPSLPHTSGTIFPAVGSGRGFGLGNDGTVTFEGMLLQGGLFHGDVQVSAIGDPVPNVSGATWGPPMTGGLGVGTVGGANAGSAPIFVSSLTPTSTSPLFGVFAGSMPLLVHGDPVAGIGGTGVVNELIAFTSSPNSQHWMANALTTQGAPSTGGVLLDGNLLSAQGAPLLNGGPVPASLTPGASAPFSYTAFSGLAVSDTGRWMVVATVANGIDPIQRIVLLDGQRLAVAGTPATGFAAGCAVNGSGDFVTALLEQDPMTGAGVPVLRLGSNELARAGDVINLNGIAGSITRFTDVHVSGRNGAGTAAVYAQIEAATPMGSLQALVAWRDVAVIDFPGTGEDLIMESAVGGAPLTAGADFDVKVGPAGELYDLLFRSPGGTFEGMPFALLAQLHVTGAHPGSVTGDIHVNPFVMPGPLVIYDSSNLGPFPPTLLPTSGMPLSFVVPMGVNGTSILFQAFSLTSTAANGVYGATNAHVLEML